MRFFIKSYGCQMNLYDSRRMADALACAGYETSADLENADVVILNTCSIRDRVDEKVFSDLGRLRVIMEKSSKDILIVVAGCMAQLRSKDILRRAPQVNAILGPQNIHKIAVVIDDLIKNRAMDIIVTMSMDTGGKFQSLFANACGRESVSEYLTIQEGCNNCCTYCIVPFTRGREFSRSVSDILEEARNLVASGVREIMLLGQNVNSYSGGNFDKQKFSLAHLLFELANINGLKRLRYITSHPKYVDQDIARAHREIEILAPSLHLPAQSGSNSILKEMNRGYTQDEYLRCIDLLRSYRPDIAFSSDFIVGFPGETDWDFEQTLKLAKKVRYAQAYSFKFSPRPGTAAAQMDNQIPEKIKSERLLILQKLLNDQQTEFNKSFEGSQLNVLFTKEGKHKKQIVGRSEYSQSVSVYANTTFVGDMARVRITEVASHSLVGMLE
ncbi:MAG: tRNA (N6-isopentenyl adenosine(37)-C2)-methylthiotransferase MiaB [Holosporaceae bacterium]|nr:tRNA (N6-isopentenyl adenosine(37)-C2)-methylthiotransferase MiaB [Holosporaceae bacterium]